MSDVASLASPEFPPLDPPIPPEPPPLASGKGAVLSPLKQPARQAATPRHTAADHIPLSNVRRCMALPLSSATTGAGCAQNRSGRRRRRGGRRGGAGVLRDHAAEARDRSLDVLLAGRAQLLVRLLDALV